MARPPYSHRAPSAVECPRFWYMGWFRVFPYRLSSKKPVVATSSHKEPGSGSGHSTDFRNICMGFSIGGYAEMNEK